MTEERAQRVERLLAADPGSRGHGVLVDRVTEDELVLAMPVRAEDANAVGVCHGGLIYYLGDTAVGIAANSVEDGPPWVTSTGSIDYLAPARIGQTLRAHCRLRHRAGRRTFFDIEVRADDTTVALLQSQMVRMREGER